MLNYIDLFPIELEFKYKGSPRIKTNIGGFFSIVYILIIIFCTFFLSENLYFKQNPKIFHKYYNSYNRSLLKSQYSNNQKFLLKLGNPKFSLIEYPELRKFYNSTQHEILLFSKNSIYDNVLISPIIHFKIIYNKTLFPLNYIECPEDFINMENKDFLCFDVKMDYLGGGNKIDEGIDLRFIMTLCDDVSNCVNLDNFKYFEKIHFLKIALANTRIQLDNYTEPIVIFDQFFFSPLIMNTITNHFISFDEIILDTDDGLVFSNSKIKKSFVFSDQTIINGYALNKTETTVIINMSNTIQHYKRTYEKLQQTLAIIGSVIKSIMIIFCSIVKIFHNRLYYKELFNNLYYFDEMKINKINLLNLKNNTNNVNSSSVKSERSLSEIRNMIFSKSQFINKTNLNYSFIELVTVSLCKYYSKNLKSKEDYMGKCKSKIDKYLDIVEIIKRFIETDRLKWILLNENEYHTMNYLYKNKINIDKDIINSEYSIENIISLCKSNTNNLNNNRIYKILQNNFII